MLAEGKIFRNSEVTAAFKNCISLYAPLLAPLLLTLQVDKVLK